MRKICLIFCFVFLLMHPKKVIWQDIRAKGWIHFFYNVGIHLLHRIRRARVEGSGSIYRTLCTSRTFSSAKWHPHSHTPLWLYFPSSCWCPVLPTQTHTECNGTIITCWRHSLGAVPTSSVSSRPLSSYSERTKETSSWDEHGCKPAVRQERDATFHIRCFTVIVVVAILISACCRRGIHILVLRFIRI